MGKTKYNLGGGANYLCLPLDPEFPDNKQTGFHSGSYIYGVEYKKWNSDIFFVDVNHQDAPCAVCEVQGRSQVLMIPAKQTCPAGWTLEYEGLLVSEHHTHSTSEFICVSSGMEVRDGGQAEDIHSRRLSVRGRGLVRCPAVSDTHPRL